MKVTKNLNSMDRALRGIIGIVITSFAIFNGDFINEPIVEILLFVFGTLNLISLTVGWCPVYHLAGINTRAKTK